ncbi:hypothetical protein F7Q91_03495 [Vibrio chagasii]|uniref:Uncharacterized protein n=1 Tax=Vibrio chagasii TaxID=170679 RepID=A0A7V7NX72_9VIBR|nr:hypothetical protein [Vibrio chagasii]KAB0482487.1 hypothetical protein F7Q91_03495 [Vibrio chagasii]
MNKYIQKIMFVVLLMSLVSALVAILNFSVELAIGSLTFSFGLLVLALGYFNPHIINSNKVLFGAIACAFCTLCLVFQPLSESAMISGWVIISLIMSFEVKVPSYE